MSTDASLKVSSTRILSTQKSGLFGRSISSRLTCKVITNCYKNEDHEEHHSEGAMSDKGNIDINPQKHIQYPKFACMSTHNHTFTFQQTRVLSYGVLFSFKVIISSTFSVYINQTEMALFLLQKQGRYLMRSFGRMHDLSTAKIQHCQIYSTDLIYSC